MKLFWMRRIVIIFTVLFAQMLVSRCVWKPEVSSQPKLIVCTTTIIGDAVHQLAGNKYEVKTLMGPGVDPHIYEAKPSDVRALGEARLIIYNGLHLEGKMTDLFKRIRHEKDIVSFSSGMSQSRLLTVGAGTHDPHVWFDPKLWLQGIKKCKDELQNVFPYDRSFFEKKYQKLKKEMVALDFELRKALESIPEKERIMITSHDAFHYFGRAYGVKVLAIQGISTVSEPGLKDVSKLVNYIVKNKVKALFVESSVSSKSIKAVIEGCLSRKHMVKIGGTLYSDALGDKKSKADTYVRMMKKNVETIVTALK